MAPHMQCFRVYFFMIALIAIKILFNNYLKAH